MRFYRNTVDVQIKEPTVITLGKFDGLHSGHQYLIECLQEVKKEYGYKAAIFTFVKSPTTEVLGEKQSVISSIEEKEHVFASMNIDYVVEYPFDKSIMMLSAEDFVKMIVEKLSVKVMVVGTDYHFGYQRRGDYKLLENLSSKYGYKLIVVKKKQRDGRDISSTWIRESIMKGDMKLVNELLSYSYFIQGIVERGNQIGRTIGFRTINLVPDDDKLLPPYGVYASRISYNGKSYYGITNIGVKPTVGAYNPVGVETNIFDFDEEIYGEMVRVHLLEKIRSEKKFQSIDEMKEQIKKDVSLIKEKYYVNITQS